MTNKTKQKFTLTLLLFEFNRSSYQATSGLLTPAKATIGVPLVNNLTIKLAFLTLVLYYLAGQIELNITRFITIYKLKLFRQIDSVEFQVCIGLK